MSIKGFRIKLSKNSSPVPDSHHLIDMCGIINNEFYWEYSEADIKNELYSIEFHTGAFDRHGDPIYEGDILRSKSCETPFKVENIVDFLMMCGEYRAKNGVDIFPSLEIINE